MDEKLLDFVRDYECLKTLTLEQLDSLQEAINDRYNLYDVEEMTDTELMESFVL